MKRGKIIVIAGPTASGKTALAIDLALRIDAEIISADSRQFYRGMDIGTAKPTAIELEKVPHHGIDICAIDEHISAGDFERRAVQWYQAITAKGKHVILTGGSGLYLQAFLFGLNAFPKIPQEVQTETQKLYETAGLVGLQRKLAEVDPISYARIDQQNPARLRRAIEVSLAAGRPYSAYLHKRDSDRPFEAAIQLLIDPPRDTLYTLINQRVDKMIAAGLEDEVRGLLAYRHLPVLQAIGYQEWFPYFDGLQERQAVIEKIKQHSRNYAKRQGTWFRKYGQWVKIEPTVSAALAQIEKHM